MDYDILIKCVVIGDSGVGKSAFINRLVNPGAQFCDSHVSTIGVDFHIHTRHVADKTVRCQIWDTAGQERFRAMNRTHYRGSHVVFLMYDVSRAESLANLREHWLPEVLSAVRDDTTLMVIGNKTDLPDERHEIDCADAAQFAQDVGALYIETSAKVNNNVESALSQAVRNYVKLSSAALAARNEERVFAGESLLNNKPVQAKSACC